MKKTAILSYAAGMFLAVASVSCSAPKDIVYFQNLTETAFPLPSGEMRIAPHDKLSIVVKSKDPELSALFNLTASSNRLGLDRPTSGTGAELRSYVPTTEGISAYTVSQQGTIDFPVLGVLKIEGMTRSELASFIKGELMGKELVKDPVVTVEFLNTGFSIMGEVNRPGRFDMNKDQLSIVEALSLAGDLTISGMRDNIALLREENGELRTYRVDITDLASLTKSPAYYVKQGDVIYVEPNVMRRRQATVNGNNWTSAGFWVSIASLLTSMAVLVFK